jgi:hypothetical protein
MTVQGETAGNVPETLDFIVTVPDDEDDGTGEMGIFRRHTGEAEVRSVPVPAHRLRENLVRACGTLVSVLEDIGKETSGLKLREAQVKFEVSASGGVQFVGTAEMKGTGGITLIFRE